MNYRARQSLLIVVTIAFSLLAVACGMLEPLTVSGQVNAIARWNPRRVPADAVFIGDQACAECHKKYVATHAQAAMAMAMEPIGASKVLGENPQLTMRNGPYSYQINRNG